MNNLSKPVIWYDIDDVILHLWGDLINAYNKEFNDNKTLEDMRNLESDKAYFIVEKYGLYQNMQVTDLSQMLKWTKNWVYNILITSRKEIYRDETVAELDRNGIHYEELFMDEKKSDVCNSEKVKIFMDDAMHNTIDVKKNSEKTQPILVERPRNGEKEIERLKKQWISCDKEILRLTEHKLLSVLNNL